MYQLYTNLALCYLLIRINVFLTDCSESQSYPPPDYTQELNTSNDTVLSELDRQWYEKIFTSIIVPFSSLIIKEEIGQGS